MPRELSDKNALSVLNKTIAKYDNVNRMLGALEDKSTMNNNNLISSNLAVPVDNSFARKIREFKLQFNEGKTLSPNSQKWKSFAKKVGAILSCLIGVGIYKAFTSDTFFGKSHGKVASEKIDSILNRPASRTMGS